MFKARLAVATVKAAVPLVPYELNVIVSFLAAVTVKVAVPPEVVKGFAAVPLNVVGVMVLPACDVAVIGALAIACPSESTIDTVMTSEPLNGSALLLLVTVIFVPTTLMDAVFVTVPEVAVTWIVRLVLSPPVVKVPVTWPLAPVVGDETAILPESSAMLTLAPLITLLLASVAVTVTPTLSLAAPADGSELAAKTIVSAAATGVVEGGTLGLLPADPPPPPQEAKAMHKAAQVADLRTLLSEETYLCDMGVP